MYLTIDNCAEFVQNSSASEVKAAVDELTATVQAAKRKFFALCDEYAASKTKRAGQIQAQIAMLDGQAKAIQEKDKALRNAMVTATLAGDPDEVRIIQEQLAADEAELSAVLAQVTTFRGYHVTGDPVLFDQIKQTRDEVLKRVNEVQEITARVYDLVQRIAYEWRTAVKFDPFIQDVNEKFERVRAQFGQG